MSHDDMARIEIRYNKNGKIVCVMGSKDKTVYDFSIRKGVRPCRNPGGDCTGYW
jgi:hypothetical protein